MSQLPVHWYEGMFLGPHHFQANDRYWNERVAREARWDSPFNYGVRTLKFNEQALRDNCIDITEIEARFRDGSTVVFGANDRKLDTLSLSGKFDDAGQLFIFLCMPRQGVAAASSQDDKAKFVVSELLVNDENESSNERAIDVRAFNCYLTAVPVDKTQPHIPAVVAPKGVESIPLMRVRRSGAEEAFPEVDPDYFPSMLDTRAWGPLEDGIIKSIFHLVGQNMDLLADRVGGSELSFSGARDEGELDDLMKLTSLNRAFATLKNYGAVVSTHPLSAYVELCRLYGDLAVFGKEHKVSRDIPAYNHDELHRIFAWLKKHIELLIHTEGFVWEKEDFVGFGQTMQATIRGYWLTDDWDWFIGVRGTTLEGFQRLRRSLNWKMASGREIEQAFVNRVPGIDFGNPLSNVPRVLPQNQSWIYHQLEKKGSAWDSIRRDKTIALMVNPEAVSNIHSWNGERIMKWASEDIELQFRLFAVPRSRP